MPTSLLPLPDRFLSPSPAQRARCSSVLFHLVLAACFAIVFPRTQAQDLSASPEPQAPHPTENAPNGSSPAITAFAAQPLVSSNNPDPYSALALSQQPPQESLHEKQPVDSELIAEGEGSFGHYHIFAYSWWSELYTGGIEYDRHTWNYLLKSQMDYVAEVLPVAMLRQPADTDVYGDPLSQARVIDPGLGIYPVGLRMKWRYNKGWQPYFIIKGGMLFFAQKALSKDAAHQNFSLQMGLGMQRRLTRRFDMRVGYEDIHFSDAFMVPSNPGLDVMAYDGGIVYRLGK